VTNDRRPTREAAIAAVVSFMHNLRIPAHPIQIIMDGNDHSAPGKCGWAFWLESDDSTSYVHEDLTIEWAGTARSEMGMAPWAPGEPPATWERVYWPEWVPEKLIEEVAERGISGGPRGYEEAHRSNYAYAPSFGCEVLIINVQSPHFGERGRYVHAWGNMGRVVLPPADGAPLPGVVVVSTGEVAELEDVSEDDMLTLRVLASEIQQCNTAIRDITARRNTKLVSVVATTKLLRVAARKRRAPEPIQQKTPEEGVTCSE